MDSVAQLDQPFVPFKPADVSPPSKTRFDKIATSGWCKCRTTILEHCSDIEITRQPVRTEAFFNSFLLPPYNTISAADLRGNLSRLQHLPQRLSDQVVSTKTG